MKSTTSSPPPPSPSPLSPHLPLPPPPFPPLPPNSPFVGPPPVTRPHKPPSPPLAVNVDSLPALIATTTYGDRLVRWHDLEMPPSVDGVVALPDPPPWSLWLQGYYRMHHPATWPILERDHETDKRFFYAVRDWRMQREAEGADEEELRRLWDEMNGVSKRIIRRFRRLFGLHFIRNRYLAYHRSLLPGQSDAEILEATLIAENYPPCTIAAHTVWALPLPPPTTLLSRLLLRRSLTQLAKPPFSSSPSLLQPYIVPGIDSMYMRALNPVPREPGAPPGYSG
ncbi:hypothetical protein JCM6882_008459 [Rhodosporidiobolus microsporus]